MLSGAGVLLRNMRLLLLLVGRLSSGKITGGSGPGYDTDDEDEGDEDTLGAVIGRRVGREGAEGIYWGWCKLESDPPHCGTYCQR